jgi:hypothetical protein
MMKRLYMAAIFVGIVACAFAAMVALQHVVSNIAKPDVLPETGRGAHDSN